MYGDDMLSLCYRHFTVDSQCGDQAYNIEANVYQHTHDYEQYTIPTAMMPFSFQVALSTEKKQSKIVRLAIHIKSAKICKVRVAYRYKTIKVHWVNECLMVGTTFQNKVCI